MLGDARHHGPPIGEYSELRVASLHKARMQVSPRTGCGLDRDVLDALEMYLDEHVDSHMKIGLDNVGREERTHYHSRCSWRP